MQSSNTERKSKDDKRLNQFIEFKKKRLLNSKFVRDLDDEFADRPFETEKRANIDGVYDPMHEKRTKELEANFTTRQNLMRADKKMIYKRVNRLKQAERIDDMTEIQQIGYFGSDGQAS